ncbi:MAG: hypothetical protein LKJ57_02420 [Ancrocorticia sp.]|jgi:hypothetical protein|nr:hypothetical protein [Ancrocorticia sp.]MCI1895551.1 hypothetical protein [Ancrocorticia sp.]MCI1932344.1 hypothetical protein [Ancrocorticia sp.]MCI1962805.1 hypothetical protein [Ancrocorticia sp.]MCI2001915.1 hypothetical protein [Ancrocorticia sp.]
MRIFIPAVARDLVAASLSARRVHTVTPALAAMFAGEDPEVLDAVAMNAAADDSLRLLAQYVADGRTPVYRRLVIAADVPAAEVAAEPHAELPTAMRTLHAVPWDAVVSMHVDDSDAEADVAAAAAGDDAAFERATDADLMWYDVAERHDLGIALAGARVLRDAASQMSALPGEVVDSADEPSA